MRYLKNIIFCIFVIFFESIQFAQVVSADSIVAPPRNERITIEQTDAYKIGIAAGLYTLTNESKTLIIRTNEEINGNIVRAARITLYSKDTEITNFSLTKGRREKDIKNILGGHTKTSYFEFRAFINTNIVTHTEVEIYTKDPNKYEEKTYILKLDLSKVPSFTEEP